MNCYLIALPPDSVVGGDSIQKNFSERHVLVQEGVWIVAGSQPTCADVCRALGIGSKGRADAIGIVLKMSEYNGFAERTLWERLNVWGEEQS